VLGFISRARLENFGVAVVLRSENADISVGDHLYGWLSEFDSISCSTRLHDDLVPAFETYIISSNPKGFQKIYNKEKLPWTVYVGALGMAGALVFAAKCYKFKP
jgi:hypothetical protein